MSRYINKRAIPDNGSDATIFFRFREAEDQNECLIPVVSISNAALNAVPESMLAKLIQDRWRQENSSRVLEVSVYESPCKDAWKTCMALWIAELYTEHLKEQPVWKLPTGVELENALAVLDYFGLAPPHPKDVDCSSCTLACQVRAKLLLNYMEDMVLAKKFCIDDMMSDPRPVKHFIFVHKDHDIQYIRQNNSLGNIPIVAVGATDEDRHKFFEWVQNPCMRDNCTSAFEEDGFGARFVSSSKTCYPYSTYGFNYIELGSLPPLAKNRCIIGVREPHPSAQESFEGIPEHDFLYVLEVSVSCGMSVP